ncbi:MAG: iron transporter [Chloroflexota bacterium]
MKQTLTTTPSLRTRLELGLRSGVRKGATSLLWVLKIIVPVSFAVMLLQWSGWLHQLDFLLHPLMQLINLPAEAALPILLAITVSFYAALASIAVIPFSQGQVILIAIFITIAHMLIMEGIVQLKSGIGIVKITAFRLLAAIAVVLVASQFFDGTAANVALTTTAAAHSPLPALAKGWAWDTLRLAGKIAIIVLLVMLTLESLKALGWMAHLERFFRPVMRLLGLSDRTTTMWIAGAMFGLVYGAAVIREEAQRGHLSKEELERLHISLGINHSMIEDPALLLAFGVSVYWSVVPRLITAALATHLYRLSRPLRTALTG